MANKRTVTSIPGIEFLLYFAASLLALLIDIALFSICLRLADLPWTLAATIGFLSGAVTAYWLSVRFVFANRVLARSPRAEFISFAAIGVAGLGITQGILWIGIEILRANPEFSKLVAAGGTFLVNYGLRKVLLFRSRNETSGR